ncbi:hypothetical protein GCM10007359_03830 [Rothia aerolata]|uniref:Uncharacterized protein n=1 Tax=Rothia aerolata TaxID=1812262 RepID=A0A917MQC8_9MICC|nr:hypothetical protein GCM10007359_03830 [Rothia aerolata]
MGRDPPDPAAHFHYRGRRRCGGVLRSQRLLKQALNPGGALPPPGFSFKDPGENLLESVVMTPVS